MGPTSLFLKDIVWEFIRARISLPKTRLGNGLDSNGGIQQHRYPERGALGAGLEKFF